MRAFFSRVASPRVYARLTPEEQRIRDEIFASQLAEKEAAKQEVVRSTLLKQEVHGRMVAMWKLPAANCQQPSDAE